MRDTADDTATGYGVARDVAVAWGGAIVFAAVLIGLVWWLA